MMKDIGWKSCLRIGVTAFALYLAVHYWPGAVKFVGLLISAAAPLLIGCVSAYILNILMSFYERHIPLKKARRPVCMVAAMVTLVLIVALVGVLVVPQLVSAFKLLWDQTPAALEKVTKWLQGIEWLPQEWKNLTESINWREKLGDVARFVTSGIGSAVSVVVNTVGSVFSGVVTALISTIFTIYLLSGKERLGCQMHRVLTHFMPEAAYQRFCHVLHVVDGCFHAYIVGQCTEALILGGLCALGMLLLQLPYATMVGALVAFTALIPVAGAYIGAAVGAFMILTVSPVKALVFLVYLVVLQQLEGNIIYPRVVGSSIGLPGIWVLAAVTIGGSLMGIVGMLLAVPLAAAAYKLMKEAL